MPQGSCTKLLFTYAWLKDNTKEFIASEKVQGIVSVHQPIIPPRHLSARITLKLMSHIIIAKTLFDSNTIR